MGVSSDTQCVFETRPVFYSENSIANRHLFELIGLDMDISMYKNYYETLNHFMLSLTKIDKSSFVLT